MKNSDLFFKYMGKVGVSFFGMIFSLANAHCVYPGLQGAYANAEELLAVLKLESGFPYNPGNNCKGLVFHDIFLGVPEYIHNGMIQYAVMDIQVAPICPYRDDGTWYFAGTRPPQIGEVAKVLCTPEQMVLSIVGGAEILPTGKNGNSEVKLVARVTSTGNPQSGVSVGFGVDVKPNSGGHDHHSIVRPKGTLAPVQGVTNGNGEVTVTFTAPEFAGIHTIKATCERCSNKEVKKEIQVKVPDLLPISPNPPQNDDGTYAYALTSVDKTHQGNGRYHVNQYYLTDQSRQNLRTMIAAFSEEGWGTVALNDASLYWGGRYDIESNWGGSHKGHREGREIDISFARARNPIPVSKRNTFYKKFCESKTVQVPFSILHHYVKNPHFHVYLEKQTACWKSEK